MKDTWPYYFGMVVLSIACLLTAFGVIYTKDLYRRLFIHQQRLIMQAQNDTVTWSKLLLEESTWSTEARVQQIASQKLGMVVPAEQTIVIVQDDT